MNLVHTVKPRYRMAMLERGHALPQAGRLWGMPGWRTRRVVDQYSLQSARWVANFAEAAVSLRSFCSV